MNLKKLTRLYLLVVGISIAFASFAYADEHYTVIITGVVPLSIDLSLNPRGLQIQGENSTSALVLECDRSTFSRAPIVRWEFAGTQALGSQTYLGTMDECKQSIAAIYSAAHNNEQITVDINEPLDSVTATDSHGKYLLVH